MVETDKDNRDADGAEEEASASVPSRGDHHALEDKANNVAQKNAEEEEEAVLLGDDKKSDGKSFDDLLVVLGEFGPYQRRVYFFLFLPTIFSAMHKLAWVFLGAQAEHRCLLPGEDDEGTQFAVPEERRDRLVWRGAGADGDMDQCAYRAENGSEVPCDRGYVYDR